MESEGSQEMHVKGLWSFYLVDKYPVRLYDELNDNCITYEPKDEPYYLVVGTAWLQKADRLVMDRFLGRTPIVELSSDEFNARFTTFSNRFSVREIQSEHFASMKKLLLDSIPKKDLDLCNDMNFSVEQLIWPDHTQELIDGKWTDSKINYGTFCGFSKKSKTEGDVMSQLKPMHASREKLMQQDRLPTDGRVPQQPQPGQMKRTASTGSFIGMQLDRSSRASPPSMKKDQ
jgi:hypothetical protein